MRFIELIEDERHHISTARCGLWMTMAMTIVTTSVDIYLTLTHAASTIPNTVYSLEGTMFTVFATWAAGPRMAAYLGPQIGAVASALGLAARDKLPNNKKDDERAGGQ